MSLFPNMQVAIQIGGLKITWYALIILCGAFLAYYLSLRQFRKWGYKDEIFENFFITMLPLAIIGARLWYVIFEWNAQYIHDPISIFYVWEGGLAIHGGIIVGTIYGLWYFRRYKVDGLRLMDVIFPNVLLAQAIGRWGNFMNQEAYGQIVEASFYNHWPKFISDHMYIDGFYRQPTFLFESVGNIIGFFLITIVYKKYGRKKRGDLFFAYLAWYGLVRIMVEQLRSDSLMIGPLKVAQFISLLGIIIGIMGIFGVFDKMFKHIWPFKRNKPVIVFDADGTLLNTKKLIFDSFKHTFQHYLPEKQLTAEELNSFFGPSLKDTFSKYFDKDQVDEVIAYYREYNHAHHDELVEAMPNVSDTLQQLKQEGYVLAILSNKLHETVEMGIDHTNIKSYFDVVLGGDDIQKFKPDPQGLLQICETLQVGHDDVIYVGDAASDIMTANNMGAYSIAYLYDNDRKEEIYACKPCACIEDMKELLDIVHKEKEFGMK